MKQETARKAALVLGFAFMGLSGWAFGTGHLTLSLVCFIISISILISVIDYPEP